jgi:hypothetical protein
MPLSPSRAVKTYDQHVLAGRAIESTLADNQRRVKTNTGPIEYGQRSRLSRFDEEEDAVDEEDREMRRELELGLGDASLNVT